MTINEREVSAIFIVSVLLTAISLLYSIRISKGFLAILRHKMSREVSIAWGRNQADRIREFRYISIGTTFFALDFVVNAISYSTITYALSVVALVLGTISYTMIGYAVYRWAKAIEHI
ncbi:MAG: hypothetical protein QXP36_08850 [Conexivisphaerales archaeon]